MCRVASTTILAACLLATACQPMRPAAVVKTRASKPLTGEHTGARRARALKQQRSEDPEYQRLLERTRRWKEQQQEQLRRHQPYPGPIHADPHSSIA
jgi:hypothetical protein